MKNLIILSASVITLAIATPAFASGDDVNCGATDGTWMSTQDAKTIIVDMGYEVRRVKREDGCYEVYAIDNNGDKVEIYMNPVTGDIVKIKRKS